MTSTVPRARRKPLLWMILVIVAVPLTLAVGAVVIVNLTAGDEGDVSRVTVKGDHVSFEIKVPLGTAISTIDSDDPSGSCPRISYRFNDHGLVAEAVSTTCRLPGDEQIVNGHHGVYRTLHDVPDPIDVTEVRTRLGSAVVFTQEYAEYTNAREEWHEPVAIVTIDDPVDTDYPTLVIRSERGELGRDAFTTVVEDLGKPH